MSAGAHATYTTSNKNIHRMIVAEHARNVPGVVVYVDAPDAACTLFLIEHGISKERLVPINYHGEHCRSIQEKTGITALCADALKVVDMFNDVSIFWLDMEQQTVPSETLKECRGRLVKDGMLALTLTFCHFQGGALKHNTLAKSIVKGAGFTVLGIEQYAGVSDIMNMHFLRAVPSPVAQIAAPTHIDEEPHGPPAPADKRPPPRASPTSRAKHAVAAPAVSVGSIVCLRRTGQVAVLGDTHQYAATAQDRRFTMTLANGKRLPDDAVNLTDKSALGVRCRLATDEECEAFRTDFESRVAQERPPPADGIGRKRKDVSPSPGQAPKKPRAAPKPPSETFPLYFVENTDEMATGSMVWALSRDWHGGFAVAKVDPATGRLLEDLKTSFVKKADRDTYLRKWKGSQFWFSHVQPPEGTFRRYLLKVTTRRKVSWQETECLLERPSDAAAFRLESVALVDGATLFITGFFEGSLLGISWMEWKFRYDAYMHHWIRLSGPFDAENAKAFFRDAVDTLSVEESGFAHLRKTVRFPHLLVPPTGECCSLNL